MNALSGGRVYRNMAPFLRATTASALLALATVEGAQAADVVLIRPNQYLAEQ